MTTKSLVQHSGSKSTLITSNTLRRMPNPLSLSSIPPALRPAVRAFVLGYLSLVGPRLFALVSRHISKKRKGNSHDSKPKSSRPLTLRAIIETVGIGFDLQRFPTFCAIFAGGSTLLRNPIRLLLLLTASKHLKKSARIRLSRFISTFVAGWLGIWLLQRKNSSKHAVSAAKPNVNTDGVQDQGTVHQVEKQGTTRVGGRTIDLTLFAIVRALDAVVGELWGRHRARRERANKWTKAEQSISYLIDPVICMVSLFVAMRAWFFYPERLPTTYITYVNAVCSIDPRYIQIIRAFRSGEMRYGEKLGPAEFLEPFCRDLGLKPEWVDCVNTVPLPCKAIHHGRGKCCEVDIFSRFFYIWKMSMSTYLPISLILAALNPSRKSANRAIVSSLRTSTFLGATIALVFYGVCLTRTRIGPRLLGRDVASYQTLESGVGIDVGLAMAAPAVFIESPAKWKDVALYLAPRALGTMVPRTYAAEKQWRERMVFATAAAIVMTMSMENPKRVRGIFGKVLQKTMKTN